MTRLLAAVTALLLSAPLAEAQTGTSPSQAGPLGVERMDAAASYPIARLQGLDKVTARISTFEAPVDGLSEFGGLEIRVRSCWKNPPEETPESAAYLEIRDRVIETDEPIFSGWMYASSPAVNALQHAVYDIWVLDCLPAGGTRAAPGAESTPAPDTGSAPEG